MKPTRVVHLRKSKFDVYIGRPSRFGNPYSDRPLTLAKYRVPFHEVIQKYREYFEEKLKDPDFRKAVLTLRGKVLG